MKMNTISTIKFHFGMQNEDFARSLYTRWEQFYPRNVERVAGEVLDKLRVKNEELRIEKLELDLGNIPEEDFDEQFPLRFREKLEEAVIQWRVESGELRVSRPLSTLNSQLSTEKPLSTLHSQFSILRHFLLHGSLPWYAARECGDIGRLFLNVLRENAGELKKFLQTCGHYTSLQQRLVYQLGDPELEKGVHLLAPGAGVFIVAYVRFLHAKYSETEQPQATRSNHRDAVWQVVYAYLLTQRSSYFDKKSFVTQTIIRLAARYNLSYESLLTRLTGELEAFRKRLTIPLELFQLLASLQGELSERQLKESFIDAAKFYRTLYPSIKKEMDGQVSADSREGLMRILANPYACRQFLQHLRAGNYPLSAPHHPARQRLRHQNRESNGERRVNKWRVEN